jgi:hypothetical protein
MLMAAMLTLGAHAGEAAPRAARPAADKWRTVELEDFAGVRFPFYSSMVLTQNYFDDIDKTDKSAVPARQFLRTDTVVPDLNIGLYQASVGTYPNLRVLGDYTPNIGRSYVNWLEVEEEKGVYKFDEFILPKIQDAVSQGQRYIPRLFVACCGGTKAMKYKTVETSTGKEIEAKLQFPRYVADLMKANKGQFEVYHSSGSDSGAPYWQLDVNIDGVYQAYDQLLTAFGKWLNTAQVTTREGKKVSVKDAILFFEFACLGGWGEGCWGELKFTAPVDDVLRFYKSAVANMPDHIIVGPVVAGESPKARELSIKWRELKTKRGYIGTNIEHIGAFDRGAERGDYDFYAERGDFVTGEFSMWNVNRYWGDSAGLWTFQTMTRMKMAHCKLQNWIMFNNGRFTNVMNTNPFLFYYLNSCVSMVGYRFVVSVPNSRMVKDETGKPDILDFDMELTNIGLTKCFFDVYKPYWLVKDKDGKVLEKTPIDCDLTTLEPKNREPLQFAYGNGKVITFYRNLGKEQPSWQSVSVVAEDKAGIQPPLKFSNYGRQKDGSYILVRRAGTQTKLNE